MGICFQVNSPVARKSEKKRIAHADKNQRRAEHAHRHKRTHAGAEGQHKKRASAANDTNLYGLSN
jgi:hypothetical protein